MADDHFGDRRTALGWLSVGGVVAALTAVATRATGADPEVELDKLPKAITDAAARVLPKATWLSAIRVEDGTNTAYELDGSDGLERDVTVMVTAAGKVVEIETELKVATNVPDKALAGVRARFPKFAPTETHFIRQGKDLKGPKDGDHVYDMRGTGGNERDIHVQVTADGDVLESTAEVRLEKVPAVVTGAMKAARPKFEIERVLALRGGDELIGYHFECKGPKGRDRTVSVTPDGTQVEVVE